MLLKKIDHWHAVVKDVWAVGEFYKKLLGVDYRIYECKQFGTMGCVIDEPLNVEFIQIVDPAGPSAIVKRHLAKGGAALSFPTDDMEATLAKFKELGVEYVGRYRCGSLQQVWMDAVKTFGVQIELGCYGGSGRADSDGLDEDPHVSLEVNGKTIVSSFNWLKG